MMSALPTRSTRPLSIVPRHMRQIDPRHRSDRSVYSLRIMLEPRDVSLHTSWDFAVRLWLDALERPICCLTCGHARWPFDDDLPDLRWIPVVLHSDTPSVGYITQSLRRTVSHVSSIASIRSKPSRSANPHMKITRSAHASRISPSWSTPSPRMPCSRLSRW